MFSGPGIWDSNLKVVHDISEDFFFCNSKVRVVIFWVRTDMDDAIHVQVEIVKLWNLK